MTKLLLKFALSSLLIASPCLCLRATDKPSESKAEHKHTPLEDQMDAMSKSWRTLRKQMADASKNESSIELVAKIKKASEEALKHKPALTEEKPEADREKFISGYQAEMKKLILELDNLSAAFKAGKNAEAADLIKKIGDMQKAGHREYKKPD